MEKKETSQGIQILIIFAICFLGEILHEIIPIPISAGVYGMVLMLILLITKIVKIHHVETVGNWLVKNMMIMFLPVSVGLVEMFTELKDLAIPVILSFSVVTILVMAITGIVVQQIIKHSKIKKEKKILCLKQ